MRQNHVRQFILGVTAGLCCAALAGCGADAAGVGRKPGDVGQDQPDRIFFSLPEGPEESGIRLEPIEGISADFIRGMDASSVLAEERSGVIYRNFEGKEQDVFMTLAQAGVNYIRLRVWNDPYDENGNGYGGGNNDVAAAVELGRRATQYGMKVCIDFHYSDFWADPKRQHAPKAWAGMSVEEKCDALCAFTEESLSKLLDAGVDVGMVQIGNEINNGMCGEKDFDAVARLLDAGSRGVRRTAEAYDRQIRVAVHYTDIQETNRIKDIVRSLAASGVDYDLFAMSYYPFWHGPVENIQAVAEWIREEYGKETVIAETSYCYTAWDGDGCGNSFDGVEGLVEGYSATVQGQASMIRDICAAAQEAGMLGVFYWEGTWIPVGGAQEDNSPLWEAFGSGWASSFAADYDPEDAGRYYGGCSWDNQAMFDFQGYPLDSLKVFRCLRYGSVAQLAVDSIPEVSAVCQAGERIRLPGSIAVVYNDRSVKQAAVTWDEAQLAALETEREGEWEVTGLLEDGTAVVCHVKICLENHVLNPSFEDRDTSMWKVAYDGDKNPTDYQVKENDAHTGLTAFHFWSGDSDMVFSIEQEFTDLEQGLYRLSVYAQGGDMADDSVLELYAAADGGEEQAVSFTLTGYADWKNPTIPEIEVSGGRLTIGVRANCNVKSWGTLDDFTLNRISP